MTHLPPRSCCEHCVKMFCHGGSSPTTRQEQSNHSQRYSSITCSWAPRASQDSKETDSQVAILHAVDIKTLMRTAAVGPKGLIEHRISTGVSFLDELGHQRVLLKSDSEPAITSLIHEVSRRRQSDNGWTTIIEEIPPGSSQVVGVVEQGNHQLGCQCFRVYLSSHGSCAMLLRS